MEPPPRRTSYGIILLECNLRLWTMHPLDGGKEDMLLKPKVRNKTERKSIGRVASNNNSGS